MREGGTVRAGYGEGMVKGEGMVGVEQVMVGKWWNSEAMNIYVIGSGEMMEDCALKKIE